jgi:hypothetical protein
MRRVLAIAVAASLFAHFTQAASASTTGAVENAFRFCAALDQTGLLSEKCSVSGWASSVDISIDTSAIEAHKICATSTDFATRNGIAFDRGWQLRIYSPFSGGKTIAICALR